MERIAQAALLLFTGAMLACLALLTLRMRYMKDKQFDPNLPDHVMGVAVMLDRLMNVERTDVRFALVVWQHGHDDVQGLVSNATDDDIVIDMLDDARSRIDKEEGVIFHPHGHA